MIVQAQAPIPIIDFGYGLSQKTMQAGTPVTVWLNTPYLPGNTMTLNFTAATLVKVSDYQYQLTYSGAGTHDIYITVSSADKTKNTNSNTITLIVE